MQILALKPPHFTFCILYVETRVLTKTTTFIPECELKVALGNNHCCHNHCHNHHHLHHHHHQHHLFISTFSGGQFQTLQRSFAPTQKSPPPTSPPPRAQPLGSRTPDRHHVQDEGDEDDDGLHHDKDGGDEDGLPGCHQRSWA